MSAYENGVYSFQDVSCSIVGPNINLIVTGEAEEGYETEYEGDKDSLTMGAGGDGMHSLRAAQNGTLTLHLLKTSSLNQALCNAYNFQTGSAANHGRNVIIIDDPVRGDTITCQGAAFRRLPGNKFAEQGGIQDWVFNCTRITPSLGAGVDTVLNG
ncbi:phage protein [Beijerinckia sp. L45]|uniref:phage protein n=1 Tax=Beijerinckia sp. L45 TaxID=1641855 RepID=UPI00131B159D|nr:phage protein [Beijerinckia sp. L45]